MIFFVQQILKLGTRGFFLAELEKFVFLAELKQILDAMAVSFIE